VGGKRVALGRNLGIHSVFWVSEFNENKKTGFKLNAYPIKHVSDLNASLGQGHRLPVI